MRMQTIFGIMVFLLPTIGRTFKGSIWTHLYKRYFCKIDEYELWRSYWITTILSPTFANDCGSGHLGSLFQVTANERFIPKELDLIKSQLQALETEMKEMKAKNADMTAKYNTLLSTNNNGMWIIRLYVVRSQQYNIRLENTHFSLMHSTLLPLTSKAKFKKEVKPSCYIFTKHPI